MDKEHWEILIETMADKIQELRQTVRVRDYTIAELRAQLAKEKEQDNE